MLTQNVILSAVEGSLQRKRDVSTTVDMTSTHFLACGSTAILLPKQKAATYCSCLLYAVRDSNPGPID